MGPPAKCKKGGALIRINCDDNGNYHPKKSEGLEHLDRLYAMAKAEEALTPPPATVQNRRLLCELQPAAEWEQQFAAAVAATVLAACGAAYSGTHVLVLLVTTTA